jgi:hypothetical protein
VTSHDFLFYFLSLAAVGAALLTAIRADLTRAADAALVGGAAVAGLLGLASAPLPASLLGACVFAGYAARSRARPPAALLAEPALDSASTLPSRLRAAALVAAFFAIAVRSVLIVRWPFADAGTGAAPAGLPAVALTHFVVVSLVLTAIGFYAAIVRRSVAGVGLGLATASAAVVLVLASVSRFVGEAGDASHLAAVVAVLATATGAATLRVASGCGDLLRGSDAAWRAAGAVQAVLAGVALALLATAW